MSPTYTNRFGRRQTRGVRPWLLLPKIVSISIYLGGLAAVLFISLAGGLAGVGTDDRRLWTVNLIGRLVRFMVVPALLVTLAMGVSLLLQHPRPFLRMRWLLVKLASLAIFIPSAHFFLSSRLALLRRAAIGHGVDAMAAREFACGVAVTIAASVWVIVLGRLKPRLGQNWARAYQRGSQ